MVVERGEVWWAELDEPRGSEPGYRRPILIVQADAFNRSRLRTVLAITLTSNLRLLDAPGNVLLTAKDTGLPRDSTAVVTQVVTVDKAHLMNRTKKVPTTLLTEVERGLALVLDLAST